MLEIRIVYHTRGLAYVLYLSCRRDPGGQDKLHVHVWIIAFNRRVQMKYGVVRLKYAVSYKETAVAR